MLCNDNLHGFFCDTVMMDVTDDLSFKLNSQGTGQPNTFWALCSGSSVVQVENRVRTDFDFSNVFFFESIFMIVLKL